MMKDTSPTSQEGETFDPSNAKASSPDVFDPFGLGDAASGIIEHVDEDDDTSSTRSPKPPPQLKRVGMYDSPSMEKGVPLKTRISSSLPPKMVIRLGLHEEVSSLANPGSEGASEVSVEGTVYVSVAFVTFFCDV
jgi:hypothetical protein